MDDAATGWPSLRHGRRQGERACPDHRIELERALANAERRRRASDPDRSVFAHGDTHAWNILSPAGSTTGFKFIDPDGVCAERAFDLAIPMREWGSAIPAGDLLQLGRQRCRLLVRASGVEQQPIWEGGVIQCVSNGLLLVRIGVAELAAVQFAIADALAAMPSQRD